MTAVVDRRSATRESYVSAVAVELGDLAADERAELIEELDDHLAALLEDRPDTDLVAELGTPRAYAAELRTAAGLTGSGGDVRPPWPWRLRDLRRRVGLAVPARLRPYLFALRPVWWVFRGYALLAGISHVFDFSWSGSGLGALVPAPGGVWGVGVVLCVLAAAASVRLGTWTPQDRGQRTAVLVLDLMALGGAVVLAGGAREIAAGTEYVYDTQYVQNCPIELSNLYGYDASGKPLDDVRLYDQNGNPFDLSVFGCNGGQFVPAPGATNAYPWPEYSYSEDAVPTGPPASLSPLPGATVDSSTTPEPSVSVSPTPSGSATP